QVAPGRRHQAPHTATLLVDQNENVVFTDGLFRLGNQSPHLIGCLAIASKEDEPARPHIREEPRLIWCQVWPRKTGDEGSMHCRTLYRPMTGIAAGHVDAKTEEVAIREWRPAPWTKPHAPSRLRVSTS